MNIKEVTYTQLYKFTCAKCGEVFYTNALLDNNKDLLKFENVQCKHCGNFTNNIGVPVAKMCELEFI